MIKYKSTLFQKKYIGDRIRFFRIRSGIKQEEMSFDLGISQACLSQWENNISTPDLIHFIKILDYFKIDIDTFLNGDIDL